MVTDLSLVGLVTRVKYISTGICSSALSSASYHDLHGMPRNVDTTTDRWRQRVE